MEKLERIESAITYYVLCNKLKDIIRTGWENWNVKRERLESIAEHVYSVQQLAIAMWCQFNSDYHDINLIKVLFMLAVHELEEIFIGDIAVFDLSVNPSEKRQMGKNAVANILKDILSKEMIIDIINEFEERETDEAKFAFACDKLECDLQCKLYAEENCVDITKQEANPMFNQERVQKLLKETGSWEGFWLTFGQRNHNYDENFMAVSTYALNNKIHIKRTIGINHE